ncbi:STAS domain-containing protein [bacterium BMS3Abin03]|jgi:anti-anti-sigma factor|nr:STAS domain-containing protein [bacterium BMS3Abin03]MCG6958303.1 STAS domain-containing protein [bacterium BMS3Abin03]
MDIHAEHFPDKSVIIIDKNKLIGIENELFQNIVQESIDKGSKDITVDLSNVEYIASWGVGLLVHAYTSCNNRNIKFNIKGVSGNVMSVLHQLKLNEIFNIV